MNETQTYRPTGKLNEDGTMMEVRLVGIAPVPGPTFWTPITPEMKAKILEQNNPVISMGAVVAITPEMRERIDSIAAGVILGDRAPKTLAEASGMETTQEEEEEWANIRKKDDRECQEALLQGLVQKDEALTQEQRQEIAHAVALQMIEQFEGKAGGAEHSGHNVNYYSVPVKHPKRPDRVPYIFEVEDLIQALNLGFHEGTILKSLVRSATERELGLAKQGGDAVRDGQKMVHSSGEHLRALKIKAGK